MGEVITSVPSPRRVAGKVSEGALFLPGAKDDKAPSFYGAGRMPGRCITDLRLNLLWRLHVLSM